MKRNGSAGYHRQMLRNFSSYRQEKEAGGQDPNGKLRRALELIHPFITAKDNREQDQPRSQVIILVTTICNQHCPFCQAHCTSTEQGPELTRLLQAAERISTMLPGARVIVTGGEPTLRDDLPQLVEQLLALQGIAELEIQTNAVAIGRQPQRLQLPPHEKLRFVVGMHGFTEKVYNRCTGSRGMFQDALSGTRHLLQHGHRVELNCVISTLNLDQLQRGLPDLPALFGSPSPVLHFSVMGIPHHLEACRLLVRFSDLLPLLSRLWKMASARGIELQATLSAHHMAVPPCLTLPNEPPAVDTIHLYEHENFSPGLRDDDWWVKGPACSRCRLQDSCLGLPHLYAEQFGFDELVPLR